MPACGCRVIGEPVSRFSRPIAREEVRLIADCCVTMQLMELMEAADILSPMAAKGSRDVLASPSD